jgi:16S rRNA (guanine527-N7)-methyltransferase
MMKTDMPAAASPALRDYVALLLRWNRAINLIGRRDEPFVWSRHVADCLQLAQMWRARPEQAIDLGSGAGLPGLVLAIAFDVPFILVEQDQGKAAFLREAARMTGAPVTVVASGIEDAALPRVPLVTARGLAPLPRLLGYAERLLTADGECLFLKGRAVDQEIADATRDWSVRLKQIPSRSGGDGVVLRVWDVARAMT